MQTLVFNTTTKEVVLYSDRKSTSDTIASFKNISTVKIYEGYYEVMKKLDNETNATIPVMRVPISNTNMFIEK
jgi:hypothetical protein